MKKSKKQRSLAHPIYWPVWFGFGLLWLLTRLPYRIQLKIGAALGTILYYLPTKLRHITEVNLRLCFPELTDIQRTQLAKKNFASLGIALFETANAWWMPDAKLKCLYRLSGLEYAEQAFAKGKGIILVSPHFTCLEMIGRLLSMHYSFGAMYRPHKKALVAFIHEKFRKQQNVTYIASNRVRELFTALEKNIAVWYAYDIDAGEKNNVFAPFFNIQSSSMTSVTRVVNRSGAAVVPISFYRNDDEMIYEIKLLPALENFPTENPVEDATRLNKILENAIREKPEQYVWQYKRFKTRPQGEKRFY